MGGGAWSSGMLLVLGGLLRRPLLTNAPATQYALAAAGLAHPLKRSALPHHCLPRHCQVTDLGSTNGTFVDGKELKAMEAVSWPSPCVYYGLITQRLTLASSCQSEHVLHGHLDAMLHGVHSANAQLAVTFVAACGSHRRSVAHPIC